MVKTIYKVEIPVREKEANKFYTIYFDINSTDCIYQIKFCYILGYIIDNRELLKILTGNQDMNKSIFDLKKENLDESTYSLYQLLNKTNIDYKIQSLKKKDSILEEMHYKMPIRENFKEYFQEEDLIINNLVNKNAQSPKNCNDIYNQDLKNKDNFVEKDQNTYEDSEAYNFQKNPKKKNEHHLQSERLRERILLENDRLEIINVKLANDLLAFPARYSHKANFLKREIFDEPIISEALETLREGVEKGEIESV